MNKLKWILILVLYYQPSYCGNLVSPYVLESSQVLPSGVRNPRFISVLMNIDQKYSETGELEPVGTRLNKTVTFQDVLDAQEKDPVKQTQLQAILNDEGFALQDSPGLATGIVSTYANVTAPVLAWGIMEDLTVGLVVPVYSIDIDVDTGFVRGEKGQQFVDAICRKSTPEKCQEAAEKLNTATSQKLERYGYQPIQSENITHVGDLRFVSKYRLLNNEQGTLTSKFEFYFPTGTRPNADKALDITTGDGRYKAGLTFIYGRPLVLGTSLNLYAGYTMMMPHSLVKRLPTSENDSLAKAEDKRELTRTLGHWVNTGVRLDHPFRSLGLTVSAGYSYQYQSRTEYEAPTASVRERMRQWLLSDLEPEQELHSLTAAIGFSTVDWYRQKKFALPLQANLVYSRPVAGRSAPSNEVVSGEMVLFF